MVAARREQDERSAALAAEFDRRRRQFYAQVAPILVELMARYRAQAIFDENSVLLADQGLNITAAVIAEMDARAPQPAPEAAPPAETPEEGAATPPPAETPGEGAAGAGAPRPAIREESEAMAVAIDAGLGQADILAIKRMIPHRYPFLLIDRVVNIDKNRSAVGIKNVSANEPHFEGHFPVRPVMPGVLVIEAMAQTSAVLVVETLGLIDSDLLVYFMSIESAKFRSVVQPGDVLELHVTVLRGRGKVWKFTGAARVGDRLCAEAEFAAMIMTQDEAAAKG